jgi:hypothetical protein
MAAPGIQTLAGVQTIAGLHTIALAVIVPDPRNPRKNFDKAKLQEIADSIESRWRPAALTCSADGGRPPAARCRRAPLARLKLLAIIPAGQKTHDDGLTHHARACRLGCAPHAYRPDPRSHGLL